MTFCRLNRLTRTGRRPCVGPDGLPGWRCRRGRYLLESVRAGSFLRVSTGRTFVSFEADLTLHDDADRARWCVVGAAVTGMMRERITTFPRGAALFGETGDSYLAGIRWPRPVAIEAVRLVAGFIRSLGGVA